MLRSVVLVCVFLLLALSHGSAQVCQWDLSADQGLDPRSLDSGARFLAFDATRAAANDSDVTAACQRACCADPQCDLALIGTPQDDGTPQCVLVGGCSGDHCVLQDDTQFQTYRRALQDNHVRPESQSDALVPPSESQSDALVPPSESQSDALVPPSESPSDNDVPKSQGDGDEKNATANTDRCRAPMKVGVCRAAFPKFYYDVANQSCREFVYGGCGANGNNFESREECEAACSGVTGSVIEEETPASADVWSKAGRSMAVDPKAGRSMAVDPISLEMWEKAVEAEAREMVDHAEEPKTTGVTVDQKVSLPEMSQEDFADRCEAAPEAGPCRASMKHWFYNAGAGACQSFIFGGCRGNKNNYENQESCTATCTVTVVPSSRKVLPPREDADNYAEFCLSASDSGPCRAYFPQFYFHADSGSCRPFVYGGCRGNNNRYLTSEECIDRCAAGTKGNFGERGQPRPRTRGTAAFFLVATLAVMSALLLAVLVVITLRRSRYTALPRRSSTVSDKEELIPESDEQSSMESISAPGSPVVGKA